MLIMQPIELADGIRRMTFDDLNKMAAEVVQESKDAGVSTMAPEDLAAALDVWARGKCA